MKHRLLFCLAALSVSSVVPKFVVGDDAAAKRSIQPNIVLIIADDMNWNDCGAYGHPAIRTPNI
ncbi:MAG: N-acetylgalactosamine-6-sulfatase, partial [Lacipirellulaceae bacterium]